MIPASDANHGRKMSADLKRFRAFARAMYRPASILAAIGALGCLAVAGFGQFSCAENALIPDSRARDYIVAPLVCLFLLGAVRIGGHAGGEKLKQARRAFELYDVTLLKIASLRVSFHMLSFVAVVIFALALLCIPVGIAFINLKSIWTACAVLGAG